MLRRLLFVQPTDCTLLKALLQTLLQTLLTLLLNTPRAQGVPLGEPCL